MIRDEDGNPVRIVWSSEEEIDTIVVWGAGDMYYRGPEDGDIIRDGEPTDFTPQSPCPDNECGLKFDDFEEPIEPVGHQDECEPVP